MNTRVLNEEYEKKKVSLRTFSIQFFLVNYVRNFTQKSSAKKKSTIFYALKSHISAIKVDTQRERKNIEGK